MEPDASAHKLILVADRDLDTRLMLAYILEMEGFRVADANNGPDTVEAAIELRPDLVLLEIVLPKLDGLAVVAHLRHNPRTRAIPVIAYTSYSLPDLAVRAAAVGINEVLRKPCFPEKLVACVRKWVEGR